MKRLREVLCGSLLVVLAATPAMAQAIKPVGPGSIEFTTPGGVNFKFGTSLDFQPMFVQDLDFNDNTNFRTITEFGSFGDNDSLIGVESRLFFTATKDRVSLYTAIEMDGTLDERVIDGNLPNIERINLSLLLPEISSTFTVGADIYALDPIGGLVYIDDDPGIWVKGGAGPWSWQTAWHKRLEFGGSAGTGGFGQANRVSAFEDREDDINMFSAKVGYDMKQAAGRFHIEPFFLAYLRDSPLRGGERPASTSSDLTACPGLPIRSSRWP